MKARLLVMGAALLLAVVLACGGTAWADQTSAPVDPSVLTELDAGNGDTSGTGDRLRDLRPPRRSDRRDQPGDDERLAGADRRRLGRCDLDLARHPRKRCPTSTTSPPTCRPSAPTTRAASTSPTRPSASATSRRRPPAASTAPASASPSSTAAPPTFPTSTPGTAVAGRRLGRLRQPPPQPVRRRRSRHVRRRADRRQRRDVAADRPGRQGHGAVPRRRARRQHRLAQGPRQPRPGPGLLADRRHRLGDRAPLRSTTSG